MIDPKIAVTEISTALQRLAKLYQIPNFDEANALILAEWIMENFKHKTLELILDTLKNPPMIYHDGNVSRSWRLTPEVVEAWINRRSIEREEERIKKENEDRFQPLDEVEPVSEPTQKMINDFMANIAQGMQEVPRVSRHDISVLKKEDRERQEGKKGTFYKTEEKYLMIREKKMQAAKARGLDKLDFRELKTFTVEGKYIVCRNLEEAREIFIEVYG